MHKYFKLFSINRKTLKNYFSILLIVAVVFTCCKNSSQKETNEPWTNNQLLNPSVLAEVINHPQAEKPIIYSIGPDEVIKSSIHIGETKETEKLQKLKKEVSMLSREADIVIYCGCCPFKDCPNVRPAFKLLNEMNFTNHKLLDLKENLKVDWISQGYPIKEL
jgi:hypothetical protein